MKKKTVDGSNHLHVKCMIIDWSVDRRMFLAFFKKKKFQMKNYVFGSRIEVELMVYLNSLCTIAF